MAAVRRAVQNLARAGRPCEEHAVAPETRERLERFRREGAGRGRGQAAAIHWEEADRMCERAEADGDLHGLRDAALIGVASHGLLRDSEVSALEVGGVNAVSLAELQVLGRWKSPAMPGRYVRGQEAARGAVARLRGRKRKKLRQVLALGNVPKRGLRRGIEDGGEGRALCGRSSCRGRCLASP